MVALTLTLKTSPAQRLDLSPLTPDQLCNKSHADILATPLWCGNRQINVGELFEVAGDDASVVVLRGTTDKLDYIGGRMTEGEIRVEGNAGRYLGMHMKSGQISVAGNVGSFAACELKGGQIVIQGDAGDFVGGAQPGNQNGMRGGLVIIKGNAGDRVGDHLRRGAILIEGNVGAYLGARMVAGTIGVLGAVGDHIGYAMRRGTLLLANAPAAVPATFSDCGTHTLSFLPLLLNSFAPYGTRFGEMTQAFTRVRRYAGDLANIGKGEILIKL